LGIWPLAAAMCGMPVFCIMAPAGPTPGIMLGAPGKAEAAAPWAPMGNCCGLYIIGCWCCC
jgi:hypothetical protein